MATALTQHSIASAKGREKPYEIRDGGARGVKGLLLRVQPSGSKTWYIEYERGKRLRIGTAAVTLTAARDEAKKIIGEYVKGNDPRRTTTSITLGNFIEKVYTPHFKAHHRSIASLGALAPLQPLYSKQLSKLTAAQVKTWRRQRLDSGINPSTINRNIGGLKTVLNHAVEEGHLPANPIAGLGNLKIAEKNRVRYLSTDEEKRLREALDAREQRLRDERASANGWRAERNYELLPDLSNLPYADYLKPMVLLTMNTGLRRGELFRLKWADVVNDDTLTVQQSKSGKARHIPLNSEARTVLRDWRATGTQTYVFESAAGRPFDNVKKSWANIIAAAQLVNFRWHDLRHHFASKLVMAAIPLNTVRELLGHSNLNMTLRYAHLAPGHLREAVEAIV